MGTEYGNVELQNRLYYENFHYRFIIAYNTAKKARRMLRARSKNESGRWSIDLNLYDDIMSKLEDAQLEFEALRRASHAKKRALEPHYEEISGKLSRAEKYLRSVLREYERNARNENVPVDGVRLPFFVSSEDAEKHSIDDRERVDTEFFFLVDDVENKLIGLILKQYTQPPASLTPTRSCPAASTSRRRRRG